MVTDVSCGLFPYPEAHLRQQQTYVVVVGGDGRCRWQQARGHPWGLWRRRVCHSCRRWVPGSSLLLPEHFQRFPRGLQLASGLRGYEVE